MVLFINRITKCIEKEDVYADYEGVLRFLYGSSLFARWIGRLFLHGFVKWPWCSAFIGLLQKLPFTKKKIAPFVQRFGIDASEFEKPLDAFSSFNDFFIRTLKKEARPLSTAHAIIPADGKYQAFLNTSKDRYFSIKGEWLNIEALLYDLPDAHLFYNGAHVVIGRLTPADCHRFLFPIAGTSSEAEQVHGFLYSVHPLATAKRPWIYAKNKRKLTVITSPLFGKMLMIEIGATNVGSIHETFTPEHPYNKGDEKGYFSFGGSAVMLLFQKDSIAFDSDLVEATRAGLEVRCLMGQSLGSRT